MYHLIREIIGRNDVKIERVPTDQNIADPLTKALYQGKFDQHVKAMLILVTMLLKSNITMG